VVWTPYPNPGWVLEYSKGATLTITPDGPSFAFPTVSSKSANMLTRDWTGTPGGAEITFTVKVVTTGAPVFLSAEGPDACTGNPPAARIFIATRDWQGYPPPGNEWRRWWSRTGFLALGSGGTFTFSAPLDPHLWGSVWGKDADYDDVSLAGFYNVLNNGGRIGLVFGGGCSYGHGLYTSGGTATFTVLGYEVR
jgi:hypothetical protein